MKQQLINFYREYVNDYLTIAKMAEHKGLTETECLCLINIGKIYHEEEVRRSQEKARRKILD